MSLENRPYAGNWSSDFQGKKYRKVVSWTPDAIVKLNGETSLAGCRECNNRIDFQSFITSVNVNASLESLGADISLSIPKHYGDSIFKDGTFLMGTGMEVHIFYRGFFPAKGLMKSGDKQEDPDLGIDYKLDEVEYRPYYPVFHGVVTSLNYSFSGGFYSASLSCSGLLHFWESQQVNTNAAYMAAKPSEDRGSVKISGHTYTGMTPHQIIYDLYRHTGGAAEGLSWAWSSKSNIRAKSATGQDFYSLSMRYWEKRFSEGMYDLRMYGVSGRLYSATEQAFLTNLYNGSSLAKELNRVVQATLNPNSNKRSSRSFQRAQSAGFGPKSKTARVAESQLLDIRYLAQTASKDKLGLVATQLQAFIPDLNNIGNINLFESSYESKKSIASKVAEVIGYEFYQDLDGDLVFKPPMYNMDTSSSRIYRLQKEDIIDISFSQDEPAATYVICKGSAFRNLGGTSMEGEFGVRGTYVDYRLVAKYGWKAYEFDTSFFNTAESAYYAAVVKLDMINKDVDKASVTIPLRPEIKMGYPVYVEHIDCFYYVSSVSHSFSFGSSCTTTLELTARRRKFLPPGNPATAYDRDPTLAVDFERTFMPHKKLYQRDANGRPSIIGFPNVVMALDPTKMDPSYLYFPVEYYLGGNENEETRRMFQNMIVLEGYRLGVLKLQTPITLEGQISADVPSTTNFTYDIDERFFKGPWVLSRPVTGIDSDGDVTTSSEEVLVALDPDGRFSGETILQTANADLKKGRKQADRLNAKGKFMDSKKKRIAIADAYEKSLKSLRDAPTNTGQSLNIVQIIDIYRTYSAGSSSGLTAPGSLSSLVQLLSNKKASFNPNQPGYYRYYSSAHPNPRYQAPPFVKIGADGKITLDDPNFVSVAGQDLGNETNVVTPVDGNEVRIERKTAIKGFNTKTLTSQNYEIVPSERITSLCFTKNEVSKTRRVRPTIYAQTLTLSTFQAEFRTGLVKWMTKKFKSGMTAGAMCNALFRKRGQGVRSAQLKQVVGKLFLQGRALADSAVLVQGQISAVASNTAQMTYITALTAITGLNDPTASGHQEAIKTYIRELQLGYKFAVFYGSQARQGSVRDQVDKTSFISPIFPISDKNGYEVFGAYAYGRGLDIQTGNAFDQILRNDPTRILTDAQRDDYLREILNQPTQQGPFVPDQSTSLRDAVNGMLEEELERAYEVVGLENGTKDSLVSAIANAITNQNDTQVVANVPARMVEIAPRSRQDVMCGCRTEDQDLVYVLRTFGQDLPEGIEEGELFVRLREYIGGKIPAHKRHQDILKGSIPATSLEPPAPISTQERELTGASLDPDANLADTLKSAYEQTIGRGADQVVSSAQSTKDAWKSATEEYSRRRSTFRNIGGK